MAVPENAPDIRVAVVDDHRLVLESITARLQSHRGLRVVVSEPTWIEMLAHHEFPVDVVVLDLHLRDKIGIGAKMRTLLATGTRAIVISQHADATSIYSAIHAGAKGFVPKTEPADELVKAIHCAADNRMYENTPVQDALIAIVTTGNPRLGSQEQRALALYAGGRSIREVSQAMGTTDDTVKSYIKRARRKYKGIGIDLGTKVLLRRQGIIEGWVTPG